MGPHLLQPSPPDRTPNGGCFNWHTLSTHIPRRFRPGDMESWFLRYFHYLLSVLFIAASTTTEQSLLQSPEPLDKAAKILWKATTPIKVKITTWLAGRDRLPIGLYLH